MKSRPFRAIRTPTVKCTSVLWARDMPICRPLLATIDTTAPSAPTIASFSTDSGTVGDGITNDSTLTLTGTAEANSTVKVYDGATLLGSATANGSGAWSLYDGGAGERRSQPYGDGDRCGRQYRCGVGGAERHDRHDGAGGAEHCLVLARYGHGG